MVHKHLIDSFHYDLLQNKINKSFYWKMITLQILKMKNHNIENT